MSTFVRTVGLVFLVALRGALGALQHSLGRLLTDNCGLVGNPADATDTRGAGCEEYTSNPQECGAYDTDDFQAARCKQCQLSCPKFTLEEALAKFPANTSEIRLSGQSLTGIIPKELSRRFPNLSVLILSANDLEGPLPDSLGEASDLTEIDLAENRLTGHIPASVGNWNNLRSANFHGNQLTGPLPEAVGKWLEVEFVDFSSNKLTGPIPAAVGHWSRVSHVDFDNNQLSGQLPQAIGAWSRLEYVNLASNMLTGPLPPEVGNWSQLWEAYLFNNKFIGKLPRELGNWKNIEHVWMQQNKFAGSIPSALGNWEHIQSVDLSFNQLSGPIPAVLGQWTSVHSVWLNHNQLDGHLPEELGNWSNLELIDLATNKLTGPIPRAVGFWSNVIQVSFDDNRFVGNLPSEVGNWNSVEFVAFFRNGLTGSIPNAVGQWPEVRYVALSNNSFTGSIPTAVGNWSMVHDVYLGFNRLTGPIPSAVGHWTQVERVKLNGNRLTGSIPPALGQWSIVKLVALDSNQLTGSIPSELGQWLEVQDVRLASNRLTGSMPPSIGNWQSAVRVNIAMNNLSGEVPAEVSRLRNLEELELQRNGLQGVLPDLSLTKLKRLLLQENALSGLQPLPATLSHLDLSRNSFASLPQAVYELQGLEVLLLALNKITSWPLRGLLLDKMSSPGALACGRQPLEPRFNWPSMSRLDVSGNPMSGSDVRSFLGSVAYVRSLTDLACRSCRLHGVLHRELLWALADDQLHTGNEDCSGVPVATPGFSRLQSLDLSKNNITEILVPPSGNLLSVDLSGNDLKQLDVSWFNTMTENRVIQLKIFANENLHTEVAQPVAGCNKSGSLALTADPDAYEKEDGGYECTNLCQGTITKYTHDGTLNTSSLCRCQDGHAGSGKNCSVCPKDTYSYSRPGDRHKLVRECRSCPVGSMTVGQRNDHVSDCRCPPGTYLDAAAFACMQCPQWPFRATQAFGEVQAAACACNTSYQGLKQADGYCGCDDGYHMNHKLLACQKCSYAEFCIWGTELNRSLPPPRVKPGFWAEPVDAHAVFASNSIWRCTSSGSCLTGGECAEGREGRACGLCQGRMNGGPDGPCEPCDEDLTPVGRRLLIAFGSIPVLVPAILIVHMMLDRGTQHLGMMLHLRALRGSLKQTVKHLQTVSVIGGFSVTWPPLAKAFFQVLDCFTLKLPLLLAAGCLNEETSATKEMLFKWVLPLIVVINAGLALPFSWAVAWALKALKRHCKGTRLEGRIPSSKHVTMKPTDVSRVLLFVAVLFWSTLAANTFEMVSCVPSPNRKFTVATYPHIQCSLGNSEFLQLSLMSFVSFLLFMCIPLRALWHGYWQSCDQLVVSACADRGWYAFLFDDFRDGHMVWTSIIMVKDALFVLIPAALPGQGAAQLLLTAAVCCLHICLVMQSQPFRDRSNSWLEAWNGATAAALCFYSVGMGYEKTAGIDDVEELFEEGIADPIYKGRAVGMVVVQVVAITIPAMVLFWQFLCAVQRTRKMLPKRWQPVSQEETKDWIREFFQNADIQVLADVVNKFDEADVYVFRTLFQHTSATMGCELANVSVSHLVRRATAQMSDAGSNCSGEQMDAQFSEPKGTNSEEMLKSIKNRILASKTQEAAPSSSDEETATGSEEGSAEHEGRPRRDSKPWRL